MEKGKRWKIKKQAIFVLLALILLVFIGFIEHKAADKPFTGLEVYVEGISDVYFVEEKDVIKLLENEFPVLGNKQMLEGISLHDLEKKVESHPFVKNAEVFTDLKGKIIVKVSQHVPMARIVRPMAADGYISTEGKVLPTSPHYTSRVMTIEGVKTGELLQAGDLSESYPGLLELIRYIHKDKFWNAQISAVEVLGNGDLILYQQVGKQTIEFGKPEEIEDKFSRINIYYKEILPQKGWNTYSRVNVKFKGQIVCE
ncbi:cell division protein FtsQ/DivIB [Negadavirga shengliensis]|uniref:Cell division protein FtsQ/DivIB n=1 Tax=Negadavirga shengliensis TaxID=1389218 RepID=A0ABV9T2P0_9BACT